MISSTHLILAALGHDCSTWTTATEATCTEGGTETGVCARCGETVTRATAPLGHDCPKWVSTATCTEAGIRISTCVRCKTEVQEAAEPLGHKWSEWEDDPDHPGKQIRECLRGGCDATESRDKP